MRFIHTLAIIIATVIISVFATSLYYTAYRSGHLHQGELTIKAVTHNRVNVVRHFDTIEGLQGYVVASKNTPSHSGILYTDHTGNYLIGGPIISKAGVNITRQEGQRYIMSAKAKSVLDQLPAHLGFIEGNTTAPHKVTVIMDPNCIFCHELYDALKPHVASGNLAVKWIVAGFLKPSSQGKAYAILSAKDPVAALASNESGFNVSDEQGGITPISSASDTVKQQVKDADNFLQKSGLPGTPVVLYRDADGTPQLISGMPSPANLAHIVEHSSNQF